MKFADYMKEPVKASEYFQKELLEYLDEYKLFDSGKYKRQPKRKYDIIFFFIEYICTTYEPVDFNEIQYIWCSSEFSSEYNSHCDDKIKTSLSRKYISDYFHFIYEQNGIGNKKLLQRLAK